MVPGIADVHRMTALLLAERTSDKAHILVVGAGGGLELSAMAQFQPDWTFTGVAPSSEMLDLARQVTALGGDCRRKMTLNIHASTSEGFGQAEDARRE